MVGITLEVAVAKLNQYLAAEAAVLQSQSYEIAERKLTRANLAEIQSGITYWSGHVDRLNPDKPVVPRPRAVGRVRRGGYRNR